MLGVVGLNKQSLRWVATRLKADGCLALRLALECKTDGEARKRPSRIRRANRVPDWLLARGFCSDLWGSKSAGPLVVHDRNVGGDDGR